MLVVLSFVKFFLKLRMSHIGKKTIFFSPTVQIHKYQNFLLIGDNPSQKSRSEKETKLKFNIPLKLTILKKNEKWNQISVSFPNWPLLTPRASQQRPVGTSEANSGSFPVGVRTKVRKNQKSLWGTLRVLLAKTINGFYKKHSIKLKFIGVGFKANLKKNLLILRLGFSHKIFCQIPKTVSITKIKKRPVIFLLQSHFLDIVKTTAFRLRSFKKPEPYKGKGILLINEFLKLKEGKKVSS